MLAVITASQAFSALLIFLDTKQGQPALALTFSRSTEMFFQPKTDTCADNFFQGRAALTPKYSMCTEAELQVCPHLLGHPRHSPARPHAEKMPSCREHALEFPMNSPPSSPLLPTISCCC